MKVIQIAFARNGEHDTLYALCDDGSIWYEVWNGITSSYVWVEKSILPEKDDESHDNF